MRIFIAGATGVLGRRLITECSDRGHDVVGLTRDHQGDSLVKERGGKPRRGDVLDRASLIDAADSPDVVVHAATAIPTDKKPDSKAWKMNDRVRREGAENLIAAAAATDADRFIQQSVVWVARQPDGRKFDETAEPNPDRTTQSALDSEEIVSDAAEEHRFDPVILRGGWFYGPQATHTLIFGKELLARNLPIIGSGILGRENATVSCLHIEDAARAYADAIEGEATGIFHVVDNEPVALASFLQAFADQLNAPSPRRIPAWFARYFVGTHTAQFLSSSMPTSNERFRNEFGWNPHYPTYRQGLEQVITKWRSSDIIRDIGEGFEWNAE